MPKSQKTTRNSPPAKAKTKTVAVKPSPKPRASMGDEVAFDTEAQLRAAQSKPGPEASDAQRDARAAVLNRLWDIIEGRKGADPGVSHSARLMEKGRSRVVQKFGEEAVECLIEAMAGRRPELIGESADVLYHLLVVWVDAGIRPEEIWEELERREGVSRLAGQTNAPLKRLIGSVNVGTTKIP